MDTLPRARLKGEKVIESPWKDKGRPWSHHEAGLELPLLYLLHGAFGSTFGLQSRYIQTPVRRRGRCQLHPRLQYRKVFPCSSENREAVWAALVTVERSFKFELEQGR